MGFLASREHSPCEHNRRGAKQLCNKIPVVNTDRSSYAADVCFGLRNTHEHSPSLRATSENLQIRSCTNFKGGGPVHMSSKGEDRSACHQGRKTGPHAIKGGGPVRRTSSKGEDRSVAFLQRVHRISSKGPPHVIKGEDRSHVIKTKGEDRSACHQRGRTSPHVLEFHRKYCYPPLERREKHIVSSLCQKTHFR